MAAPLVFSNGFFAVSTDTGTPAETHFGNVKEIQLPVSREELDDSVMGDAAKVMYPGVQTGDAITVRFKQDYAAGSVDAKLWNIHNNRIKCNIRMRPTNAAVSSDNPSYFCDAYLTSYPPLGGAFGVAVETTATWRIASGSYIQRSSDT